MGTKLRSQAGQDPKLALTEDGFVKVMAKVLGDRQL